MISHGEAYCSLQSFSWMNFEKVGLIQEHSAWCISRDSYDMNHPLEVCVIVTSMRPDETTGFQTSFTIFANWSILNQKFRWCIRKNFGENRQPSGYQKMATLQTGIHRLGVVLPLWQATTCDLPVEGYQTVKFFSLTSYQLTRTTIGVCISFTCSLMLPRASKWLFGVWGFEKLLLLTESSNMMWPENIVASWDSQ